VALAGLLAAGCGGSGASSAPAFLGRVTDQGEDAVIGAVSDGTDVSFYVCGGPSSFASETHWFLGKVGAGGALDVTANGWHLTGNLDMGSGQVVTDQARTLSWSARPAAGALEGLYQVMDGACRTGAVVGDFGDGMGTRLQGTWCGGGSQYAQVTPIKNPLTLDGEGIQVQVEGQTAKTLVVARIAEPLPVP
jgi:hypothetical protein